MCRDGNVCRGTIDGVVYGLLGACPQYVKSIREENIPLRLSALFLRKRSIAKEVVSCEVDCTEWECTKNALLQATSLQALSYILGTSPQDPNMLS